MPQSTVLTMVMRFDEFLGVTEALQGSGGKSGSFFVTVRSAGFGTMLKN